MTTPDGNRPSALDPEDWSAFERVLVQTAHELVAYLRGHASERAWRATPDASLARIREPFAEAGEPLSEVIETVMQHVLPYPTGNIHGRTWAWVSGTGTASGLVADTIASAMNSINLGFDQAASTHVELHLVDELRQALGFSRMKSGILTTGTSTGTLIALAAAREARAGFDVRGQGMAAPGTRPLRLYCSAEAHNSVNKAANLLGFGERGTCVVPVRADLSMDVDALVRAIQADRTAGWHPVAVVGTVGTVNTGAVDDMATLRMICNDFDLWLHADAAFGAALLLLPDQPDEVTALRDADSVAFDLHKWFYQQYDLGAVFMRDAAAHRSAFAVGADYLNPLPSGHASGPTNFSHYGVQLSRSFRALRAWVSLRHLGWQRFREAIARNLTQARYLTTRVESEPSLALLAPTRTNVVNFRYVGALPPEALDDVNRQILMRLQNEGIAVPSSTVLPDGFAIRVALVNHRTVESDLDALIDGTVRLGDELSREGAAA